MEAYSRVSAEMIHQLTVGEYAVGEADQIKLLDTEALKKILQRVGGNLTDEGKQSILSLVDNNQIADERYRPLVYLLSKLSTIYESQRKSESIVRNFTTVCNSYLVFNKVEYEESSARLRIVRKGTDEEIECGSLSSGEKQIISLFAHLYLAGDKKCGVLFDEPELSLSVDWQRQLLSDVLRSPRCAFLVAATHSPFIFHNSLSRVALALEDLCE